MSRLFLTLLLCCLSAASAFQSACFGPGVARHSTAICMKEPANAAQSRLKGKTNAQLTLQERQAIGTDYGEVMDPVQWGYVPKWVPTAAETKKKKEALLKAKKATQDLGKIKKTQESRAKSEKSKLQGDFARIAAAKLKNLGKK